MKVMVARTAYIWSAGVGYGIGLNEAGDRIEFMGDWRVMSELGIQIAAAKHPQPADVDDWQIVAANGEPRLPLAREAMTERAELIGNAWRPRADRS
jgi:hypothetical protein